MVWIPATVYKRGAGVYCKMHLLMTIMALSSFFNMKYLVILIEIIHMFLVVLKCVSCTSP